MLRQSEAKNYNFVGSLPDEGREMPIKFLPNGKTLLIHRYHKPGQKGGTTARKTIPTQDKKTVANEWAKLINGCDSDDGSLTVTFSECVEHAIRQNNCAGMSSCYSILYHIFARRDPSPVRDIRMGLFLYPNGRSRMSRKVKETLSCECWLLDSEKLAYSKKLAEEINRKKRHEDSLKSYNAQIKSEIASNDAQINLLSEKLNTGKEYRDITCNIEYNWQEKTKTWIRTDTWEICKECVIPMSELQTELEIASEDNA